MCWGARLATARQHHWQTIYEFFDGKRIRTQFTREKCCCWCQPWQSLGRNLQFLLFARTGRDSVKLIERFSVSIRKMARQRQFPNVYTRRHERSTMHYAFIGSGRENDTKQHNRRIVRTHTRPLSCYRFK